MPRYTTLRTALAFALLIALVAPTQAFAASAPDAYEAGAGDDTSEVARDLTDLLGAYGSAPYTEAHTLDATTSPADEDWFRIEVSHTAWEQFESYLFEAVTSEAGVAPRIEVFGPDTTTTVVVSSDAGAWLSASGASVSLVPAQEPPLDTPHTYYVRVSPGPESVAGSYTLRAKRGQFTRIAGSDRYDTAVQISRERFASGGPASAAVIVASGETFADALAGSTLAGVLHCPVLLTRKAALPSTVAAEISRLGAHTVYVLGGTGAVSAGVATAIDSIPGVISVPRVFGATRVDTAAAVVRKARDLAAADGGSLPTIAFVCNAGSFPDALAVSPAAAFTGAPILLTRATSLDAAASSVLNDPTLGITDVVIAGGTGAVSAAVETSVRSIMTAKTGETTHVRRVFGATRYETAKEIALWATGGGVGAGRFVGTAGSPAALPALDYNRVGVASGADFPDALAGGVSCGLASAPILLTTPAAVSTAIFAIDEGGDVVPTCYAGAADWAILRSYTFGGTGAVGAGTFTALDLVLSGDGSF